MTIGLIVGIIIAIIIFIILCIACSSIQEIISYILDILVVAAFIGVVIWGLIASVCSIYISHKYSKDEYLVVANETKYDLYGANIIGANRSNTLYLAYTKEIDSTTDKAKMDDVTLIDEDIENPYLIVRELKCKYHFMTHTLDTTEYEYHGKINELYK